jgi:hypothetical protein
MEFAARPGAVLAAQPRNKQTFYEHRARKNLLPVVSRICYTTSMALYRFVSSRVQAVRAFTSDATGSNLPTAYAPWRSLYGGQGVGLDAVTPSVADRVRLDGYFLLSGASGQSRR